MRGEGDATVETKVWDLPTRLFHWALALTLVGSFLTVRAHDMRLHALCGYTALTLVLFRILWGLFGSESARFASFLRGPGAVFAHVRALLGRRPDHETTHNALGGWAVMLMLGLVLAQGATGLFANDDILFRGLLEQAIQQTALAQSMEGRTSRRDDIAMENERRAYLAGAAPSYADYALFGSLQWARCGSPLKLLEPGDVLYDWRQRLLDSFDGMPGKAVGFPV